MLLEKSHFLTNRQQPDYSWFSKPGALLLANVFWSKPIDFHSKTGAMSV
jgi:hypothetical protein